MIRRLVCCAALLLLIVIETRAETFDEKYGKLISDAAVREAIMQALSKIGSTQCAANQLCAGASSTEIQNPPVTTVDARAAMVVAIKSALAQWCGLDFKRSFLPMIAFGRQQMKMNDRQLMLMTLIHGNFQGLQLRTFASSGQCPPKVRDQLDSQLPKLK